MNLQDAGFSLTWLVLGWLLTAWILHRALKTAPWHKVAQDTAAQHVLLGFSVVLFFVWYFGAELESGLNFHFLLMGLATVMFGWQFALVSSFLAVLGLVITSKMGLWVSALNWLVLSLLPVWTVHLMVAWAYRVLDRSFFVFVFFNGFLASAVACLLAMLGMTWLLWLGNVVSTAELEASFVRFIPLLVVPEGFVNGIALAALVLLKPEWLSCYSDEAYLKGK